MQLNTEQHLQGEGYYSFSVKELIANYQQFTGIKPEICHVIRGKNSPARVRFQASKEDFYEHFPERTRQHWHYTRWPDI